MFDACAMTNMDMTHIPAAGGVDSTALCLVIFTNSATGSRRRRRRECEHIHVGHRAASNIPAVYCLMDST